MAATFSVGASLGLSSILGKATFAELAAMLSPQARSLFQAASVLIGANIPFFAAGHTVMLDYYKVSANNDNILFLDQEDTIVLAENIIQESGRKLSEIDFDSLSAAAANSLSLGIADSLKLKNSIENVGRMVVWHSIAATARQRLAEQIRQACSKK
ncbi:MAG: hypothetical protein IT289_07610 [Oligoflexia bacterium]|nr:hypothetical protein [Oligoflexia bacterium]